MRILFDQGTPEPLRKVLANHQISTAFELGWSEMKNGELLAAAEKEFDAFITTDKNLRYQQNLAGRRLAILVLPTTNWREIRDNVKAIVPAVDGLKPGNFIELSF